MKKEILYYLVLLPGLAACNRQPASPPQTLYDENFNWTITIPENFNSVSPDDWKKLQSKGTSAIENTFGEEVINQAQTIFVFKNADFNYLESNYQPFDATVDGNYHEARKSVNEILFETFKTQMPDATVDSASSVVEISGLNFYKFNVKLGFPNGVTMHSLMYSRLFGTREFSVNIMYVDEEQGKKMLSAWENSSFK